MDAPGQTNVILVRSNETHIRPSHCGAQIVLILICEGQIPESATSAPAGYKVQMDHLQVGSCVLYSDERCRSGGHKSANAGCSDSLPALFTKVLMLVRSIPVSGSSSQLSWVQIRSGQ